MRRPLSRHDAQRDTMWVGKGSGPLWLVVVGLAGAAVLAAGLLD